MHYPPAANSRSSFNGDDSESGIFAKGNEQALAKSQFPKVAVITRTKNRALLLRRSIASVLKQTFEDWIHVIVNDGGDRISLDSLLSEYADDYRGRMLVIHNAESTGMQNASNTGIRASQSDYITIHDDDDSWHPRFLEECVSLLENSALSVDYAGVVCQTERVLEHITLDGRIIEEGREPFLPFESVNLYQMAGSNLFAPIAFLYKRKVHEEIGFFNHRYTVLGDWDFNLRFLLKYQIAVHDRALAYYHWRDSALAGIYANSVTNGIDEHHQMGSLMRNDYLRQDLAANRQGLGFLLNLAKPITGNSKLLSELNRTAQQTLNSVKGLKSSSSRKKLRDSSRSDSQAIKDPAAPSSKFRTEQSNREFVAAVRKRLRTVTVLSVDIFDTAIFRLIQAPIDLFKWMEPAAQTILGRPDFPFAAARFSAEQVARTRQKKRAGHVEVTLQEIYDVMLGNAALDPTLAPRLIEIEHSAEIKLCYANPVILKLCREALKRGKQLVYLSDMYLGSAFLEALLVSTGFPVAPVIVSNEHGTSKHEGGLFEVLLKQLGVAPEAVLHIGDKRTADLIHPRKAGLKSAHYHVTSSRETFASGKHPGGSFAEGNIASSLTIGLANARLQKKTAAKTLKTRQFWDQVGYEIAGPLYLGYANWIFQRCEALKIDRVYFLARDGKNVSEVFDKLSAKWGGKFSSYYMLGSRRLLNFARIETLDERSLDFLMSANPAMRLRHFFERIGLDFRTVAEDWPHLRRRLWNQLVTNDKGGFISSSWSRTIKEIFLSLEHRIITAARNERDVLQDYFDSIDFPSKHSAVVDVGWQASLLHSLHELVGGKEAKSRLTGLYFGTWKQAQRVADAGVTLESWYIDQELPKNRAWTVWECVEFVEFLFNASHPTIIGLDAASGKIEPIYGRSDIDCGQLTALKIIGESAFQYVDDFLELHPSPPPADALLGYLDAAFKRILTTPRKDEAKILGRMPHRSGFGDGSPVRFLARPPLRILRKLFRKNHLRLYKQSFWKKGYLAQLTAREAAKLKNS